MPYANADKQREYMRRKMQERRALGKLGDSPRKTAIYPDVRPSQHTSESAVIPESILSVIPSVRPPSPRRRVLEDYRQQRESGASDAVAQRHALVTRHERERQRKEAADAQEIAALTRAAYPRAERELRLSGGMWTVADVWHLAAKMGVHDWLQRQPPRPPDATPRRLTAPGPHYVVEAKASASPVALPVLMGRLRAQVVSPSTAASTIGSSHPSHAAHPPHLLHPLHALFLAHNVPFPR